MQVALTKEFNRKLIGIQREADRRAINSSVERFYDNPSNPGLNLEPLAGKSDLFSVRVNNDMRIILYRAPEAWTMLHVDHHDAAYRWAARAKVERHPRTRVVQLVHTEEVYREQVFEQPAQYRAEPPIFAGHADDYLLSIGVPVNALPTLKDVRSEDDLEKMGELLPEGVWERLLNLYCGEPVEVPAPEPQDLFPLQSPEAQRQFVVVEDRGELRRALELPWEEWLVFLHPLQRQAAKEDFRGPAKITGTAGTGKTVVAIHRARHLADNGKRVFLTTYSRTLAADLTRKLGYFRETANLASIRIGTVHSAALELLRKSGARPPRPADSKTIGKILDEAASRAGVDFSPYFLRTEWSRVIVAQGIETWEQYRSAPRVGRGIPLRVQERREAWDVFFATRQELRRRRYADFSDLCRMARERLEAGEIPNPYDAVIVDEVQDLNPQEILLLKAIGGTGPNGLALIGDGGQRIYPGGYSLRALGIEVRGRSRRLHVNYRTSEQIRRFADRVLGEDADDLDDGNEKRTGTRNLFGGPEPEIHGFENASEEDSWVADRISDLLDEGFEGDRIGVFSRLNYRLSGMERALKARRIDSVRLKDDEDMPGDFRVRLGTMHRVKGLEFQAVFVISINDDILPHHRSFEDPDDALEVREALQRERQLLYVNITRARELVYLTYHGSPSPFLREAFMPDEEEETA